MTPARQTRVDLGTLATGLGALLLLISLFLDWYGLRGGDGGITAWDSFELLDALLAALALAGLYAVAVAVSASGSWPSLPPAVGRLAGPAALILVVVTLIDDPPLLALAPAHELKLGIWLALVGALLMTLGAFLGRVRISFVTGADDGAQAPPPVPPHDPDAQTRPLP